MSCIDECPQSAITKEKNSVVIDRLNCDLCRRCHEACVFEALAIAGREVPVESVLVEMEKDRVFFDESGGGVTLSGGEPLAQPDFLRALLEELRKRKFNVVLDTSGYAPSDDLGDIIEGVDLILYDLKIMDDREHEKHTGVSNKLILENLRRISANGKPVIVRIPLVSGITDDDENIMAICDYLLSLSDIREINILPYHEGGADKYRRLRGSNPRNRFRPPPAERVEKIRGIFISAGFATRIGG